MSKDKKEQVRVIYKKDPGLCRDGFVNKADADEQEKEMKDSYPEPKYRVRCRLRRRTGLYDIVVKVRTEVPVAATQQPSTPKQEEAR